MITQCWIAMFWWQLWHTSQMFKIELKVLKNVCFVLLNDKLIRCTHRYILETFEQYFNKIINSWNKNCSLKSEKVSKIVQLPQNCFQGSVAINRSKKIWCLLKKQANACFLLRSIIYVVIKPFLKNFLF